MIHVRTNGNITKIYEVSNTLQAAYLSLMPWDEDCIMLTDAETDQITFNKALIPELIKQLQALYEKPAPPKAEP